MGSGLIEARRPVIVSLSQEIEGWTNDIQGKPFVSTMKTFGNVRDPSELQAVEWGDQGDLGHRAEGERSFQTH